MILLKNIRSTNLICWRYVHRNHPGHKPRPLAVPDRPTLPDNYVDEAIYPPVKPKLPPGEFHEDYDPKLAWLYHDEGHKYTSLKTIQERLSVLAYSNVQQTLDDLKQRRTRFYPIYQTSTISKTPRMLPFNQYITKTHVQMTDDTNKLSHSQNSYKNLDYNKYEMIKTKVKEIILNNHQRLMNNESIFYGIPQHNDTFRPECIEKQKKLDRDVAFSNLLIRDIFNFISSVLSSQNSNLINAQYGFDVNIKSYWKRCGFKEERPRGAVYPDTDVIRFQFDDIASYQIKMDKPLKPLFKLTDEQCKIKIDDHIYNPSVYKLFSDHILPMQIPGHWYGDKREFNHLTVYNTVKMNSYMNERYSIYEDKLEFLKSMAVNSGHAELTAQAYYLGYSMWKDLTYPLLGQYMFTDGKYWSFSNYQLNTIRLWNKATSNTNLCFVTQPKALYELNETNTDFKTFNDDIFNHILNVLLNKPIENETEIIENYSELDYLIGGSGLRPYLAVNDFEKQLTQRHKLFAISLYELVKYDKPMSYLLFRSKTVPEGMKPKFHRLYDKYTYEFRDIVLNYYPRDFYGFQLVDRMLKKAPKQTSKFWDLKHPVYEWANVPPPDTNNIPRNIQLPQF
ncbi:unnamed protein product [Brachionus calyciflorus]|uniref:28S ribosomal protein S30, mitochondrial n=1 Tax=Brachionus calyciflorus TaxID=104777 RepID=A0A814CRE6_9BILA|nr:unnamed protein product [Brachionus calyciflorus]